MSPNLYKKKEQVIRLSGGISQASRIASAKATCAWCVLRRTGGPGCLEGREQEGVDQLQGYRSSGYIGVLQAVMRTLDFILKPLQGTEQSSNMIRLAYWKVSLCEDRL